MSLIEAIKLIIDYEKDYKAKLELLTNIGITSQNEETFKSCEKIRDELVEGSKKGKSKGQDSLHSTDWKRCGGDSRDLETNGLLERDEALSKL